MLWHAAWRQVSPALRTAWPAAHAAVTSAVGGGGGGEGAVEGWLGPAGPALAGMWLVVLTAVVAAAIAAHLLQ